MQREKWLIHLLFDTTLIDHSFLSEKELFSLKRFLIDKKTLLQIGKEIELTDERVRQLIENGIGKVFLTTKNLIAKSTWLQKTLDEKEQLQMELTDLKLKFKKELAAEQQLSLSFDEKDISIDDIPFSVRAKKVLADLKINSANQLSKLSLNTLTSVDKVGVKTVHEIVRRAEEIGIKIL